MKPYIILNLFWQMNLKILLSVFVLFLGTALLLMWPCLYNHFPLTNPDTGAYIHNGFVNDLPKDRPVFYSWYIRLVSRDKSLWYVVLSQCLLLAALMVTSIYQFFPKLNFTLKSFAIIIVSICTSVGWFSGQLMPDIFTSIILLSILLLYRSPNYSVSFLLSFIIIASSCLHNSNLINVSALAIGLIILSICVLNFRHFLRPSVLLLAISAFSWITSCAIHYQYNYGFTPSRASHIFVMGRMVENGILKKYLDEYCPSQDMKLCAHKDNLPENAWNFIWCDDCAFTHSGGWDSSKNEYNRIIKSSLSQPKYIGLHLIEAIKGTVKEISLINIGDGLTFNVSQSNLLYKIEEHFPDKLQFLRDSKQAKNILTYNKWNVTFRLFALFTILLLLYLLFNNKLSKAQYTWLMIVILYLLINAFTSSTFANVLPRLNARVFWVLPFFCTLIILEQLENHIENKKAKTIV